MIQDNESRIYKLLEAQLFDDAVIRFARFLPDEMARLVAESGLRLLPYADTAMDWVYPIHVLDTAKVVQMEGSKFAKIRNKIRCAQVSVSSVERISRDPASVLQTAYAIWLERMRSITGKTFPEAASYYNSLINLLREKPDALSGVMVRDKVGEILGAAFWSVSYNQIGNLYVNICKPGIVGLSDLLLMKSCSEAKANGVSLMNLGGSETPSLNDFKAKYDPIASLTAHSYRVDSLTTRESEIASVNLGLRLVSTRST